MDTDAIDRKLFHKLVSIDEAIQLLESEGVLSPLGIEEVELIDSYGRVIAEDIYAPIDYPPFDRSEVDGYAVMVKSIEGADELNPVELIVKGSIGVGEEPKLDVNLGEAIEIATGAVIPRGAEGVIMEEFTEKINNKILVYKSIYPGENIAYAGSDISIGELIIPKGTMLSYNEIGILAALGIRRVRVYKVPRVLVISTGNEVIEPGSIISIGKLYDVNGYLITAFLRSLNVDVKFYGIVEDNENKLYNIIMDALKNYDIIITSGGTSAGLDDIVYRVFNRIGKIVIHGLKLKPGKPTVIAVTHDKKILVGLPGFPFSVLSNVIVLLKSIIERIIGLKSYQRIVKARIGIKLRKDIGRRWLIPVVLNNVGGELYAIPFSYSSGSISILVRADGIAILYEDRDVINEGEYVDIIPLDNKIKEGVIMGSHDILLNDILSKTNLLHRFKVVSIGSYNGVELIKKGYIDIAPIHIFDIEEGLYNIPLFHKDAAIRE